MLIHDKRARRLLARHRLLAVVTIMTHFYTLLSKDIDESIVCGTLDQALCQVGEDTTGAVFTELDHEGKYHTTVASVAIANKWLDRFGLSRDVPPFVQEFAWDEYINLQQREIRLLKEQRSAIQAYRRSVGVRIAS